MEDGAAEEQADMISDSVKRQVLDVMEQGLTEFVAEIKKLSDDFRRMALDPEAKEMTAAEALVLVADGLDSGLGEGSAEIRGAFKAFRSMLGPVAPSA